VRRQDSEGVPSESLVVRRTAFRPDRKKAHGGPFRAISRRHALSVILPPALSLPAEPDRGRPDPVTRSPRHGLQRLRGEPVIPAGLMSTPPARAPGNLTQSPRIVVAPTTAGESPSGRRRGLSAGQMISRVPSASFTYRSRKPRSDNTIRRRPWLARGRPAACLHQARAGEAEAAAPIGLPDQPRPAAPGAGGHE
jgi:hypothetical protein